MAEWITAVQDGKLVMGCALSSASPTVAEAVAGEGFDFCLLESPAMLGCIQGIKLGGSKAFVKVAGAEDTASIQQCLDAGATGVVVPGVCTAAQAEKAVNAMKYPMSDFPDGTRGIPSSGGYLDVIDCVPVKNPDTVPVIQIETAEALENLDEILQVKGLDVALVNPGNLAASMGLWAKYGAPGCWNCVEFKNAVAKIAAACKKYGVIGGYGLTANADVADKVGKGFCFVVVQSDMLALTSAIKDCVAQCQEARAVAKVDTPPYGLTTMAKDNNGLLPQPKCAKRKTALIEIYVRSQPFGGSDKSSNGHRYDSIPFANGMINSGMSCEFVHYVHEEHAKFFEYVKRFDALIVRCNPGQINADGGSQQKFDDGMRDLKKLGIQVWPSPDVMEFMGAKDALTKIATLNIGLEDTLSYYTEDAFIAGFKKTMAFQPRVIKQNRGSAGEGIWIIKLKAGNYCKTFGERMCDDSEVLSLMEANDNHSEEHTVAEFIEWCINGRTAKSGTWTSKGTGKYLEGGKAAGGQLVDQRFCPRIVEGELRYNCVGPELVGIIHKKPKEGGISAVSGTGSVYTFYEPDEPLFANLTRGFLGEDMPKVMPSLGLADEPIPLWWTSDFINASPPGTPSAQEKWIVGEFNCSCVGISKCLPAFCNKDNPDAKWDDIPDADKADAMKMGNKMGEVALKILSK